jgi:hypothetical protein
MIFFIPGICIIIIALLMLDASPTMGGSPEGGTIAI